MENNYKGNKGELQTRREFFKKTAKGILPMLGAFVAAPTVIMGTLSSCGCYDCEAVCQDDCVNTCSGSCSDTCYHSSTGSGCSDCSSSCSGTSASSTCSSCANDCSSSCKDECLETCENTCSTTCEGTCSSTCEGSATGKPTTGTIDGHEYVDLGLSVLWATCNLGANSPDETGDWYAFADPDEILEDVSYRNKEALANYYDSLHFEVGDTISGTNLDVAKKKWGSLWRIPRKDDFAELIDNCSIQRNGNYLEFTSKINDNRIFLPLAGSIDRKGYLDEYGHAAYENQNGIYWAGDIVEVDSRPSRSYWSRAAVLCVYKSGGTELFNYDFETMFSIRPVAERNGETANCNGSCTANCSSDCTSTCKNSCETDCVGGCGKNCTGSCEDSCKGSCSNTCSTTCTGNCKGGCSGSCGYGCSGACTSCTATCADTCKAQTQQGCSDCSNDCTNGCGGSCERDCSGSCGMGCAQTCGGSCSRDCIGGCNRECRGGSYANTSWCAGCVYSCDSYCANTCSFYCYSSCQNNGRKG